MTDSPYQEQMKEKELETAEDTLAHICEKLMEETFLHPEDDEIDDLLEQTITEVGRVVSFHRTDSGWTASVEPWEKMRERNIANLSDSFVKLTRISIDQTDGRFRFKISGA